jgi:hypothetical protein
MSRSLLARCAFAAALSPLLTACSLGQGSGEVTSDALFVHECWGQKFDDGTVRGDVYDLKPDFFAAIPFRTTQMIRVQRGNDLQEVSDGLLVEIDDVDAIRSAITSFATLDAGLPDGNDPAPVDAGNPPADGGLPDGGDDGSPPLCVPKGSDAGTSPAPSSDPRTFQVAIPAGVRPPGSPSVPPPDLLSNPPIVHMSLFLHRSCHNQNTVLQAVSGTITFRSLFSGNPNESQASEKLTDATFDVQMGDLADVPLGHYAREIPCELQSNVKGNFRFYFERGQPGQPFP